jgi:hypothetical protein
MRNTRPASVSAMRRPIRSNSFVSCRASSAAIAWLTAMVGKRFGRGFALEQGGGHKFDPHHAHHPVLPKPQIPAPPLNRPFLWGFSLVSFRSFRLWRHFAVSQPDFSLASLHPKIPFPASGFSTARSRSAAGNFWGMEAKNDVSNPVHNYCGFNPRASNCWLHSAGASRSRSTPIPRGKRPSTAARTRSGARNASEIVMLT